MMRSTGQPSEWAKFLDAKSPSEALDALAIQVRYLEDVYNDLSACVVRVWECPMPDIPDALLIARAAVAESMSLLEHVGVRIGDDKAGAA
jgi:hypothetical protein